MGSQQKFAKRVCIFLSAFYPWFFRLRLFEFFADHTETLEGDSLVCISHSIDEERVVNALSQQLSSGFYCPAVRDSAFDNFADGLQIALAGIKEIIRTTSTCIGAIDNQDANDILRIPDVNSGIVRLNLPPGSSHLWLGLILLSSIETQSETLDNLCIFPPHRFPSPTQSESVSVSSDSGSAPESVPVPSDASVSSPQSGAETLTFTFSKCAPTSENEDSQRTDNGKVKAFITVEKCINPSPSDQPQQAQADTIARVEFQYILLCRILYVYVVSNTLQISFYRLKIATC